MKPRDRHVLEKILEEISLRLSIRLPSRTTLA